MGYKWRVMTAIIAVVAMKQAAYAGEWQRAERAISCDEEYVSVWELVRSSDIHEIQTEIGNTLFDMRIPAIVAGVLQRTGGLEVKLSRPEAKNRFRRLVAEACEAQERVYRVINADRTEYRLDDDLRSRCADAVMPRVVMMIVDEEADGAPRQGAMLVGLDLENIHTVIALAAACDHNIGSRIILQAARGAVPALQEQASRLNRYLGPIATEDERQRRSDELALEHAHASRGQRTTLERIIPRADTLADAVDAALNCSRNGGE
jgi:hypothetical protein